MSHYDANLFFLSWTCFFLPTSFVIACSPWSSAADDPFSSLHASCSSLSDRWGFSSLFVWPLVVFLSCLSCLSDCISCCCFTIFDGLLLISSKYIRDPRPDITWSSYGRPLLCDSLLRVDLDPSDRVIQPASFTTAGAIDHIPSEGLTITMINAFYEWNLNFDDSSRMGR